MQEYLTTPLLLVKHLIDRVLIHFRMYSVYGCGVEIEMSLCLIILQHKEPWWVTLTIVEPLNYRHHRTTLNCPQWGGILYTESVPVNVMTLSSCCMPRVRAWVLIECRESLKHWRMDRKDGRLQEQQIIFSSFTPVSRDCPYLERKFKFVLILSIGAWFQCP